MTENAKKKEKDNINNKKFKTKNDVSALRSVEESCYDLFTAFQMNAQLKHDEKCAPPISYYYSHFTPCISCICSVVNERCQNVPLNILFISFLLIHFFHQWQVSEGLQYNAKPMQLQSIEPTTVNFTVSSPKPKTKHLKEKKKRRLRQHQRFLLSFIAH